MNLRRKHKIHPEVSTASLNDIMFFLMLFFLICSTLVNPNVIKLMLPKAQSHSTLTKQPITIAVTADKQYYINNKPVDFPDLESAISTFTTGMAEPTVVLRVDASLAIQDLVDLLSLGSKMKVKMILATDNRK